MDEKAKASIAALEADRLSLKQSVSTLTATNGKLQRTAAALEVEVQGLQSANQSLAGKLASLEEEVRAKDIIYLCTPSLEA